MSATRWAVFSFALVNFAFFLLAIVVGNLGHVAGFIGGAAAYRCAQHALWMLEDVDD